MLILKRFLTLSLAFSLLLLPVYAAPGDSAGAAVLIHADSGKVLYAHNENEPLPMASTTKLMTALLVLEQGSLSDTVTVSARAAGVEGSSMYLRPGEELSVEELLYGLMLSSGNDAAMALAEYCAGTVEEFVRRMNEKAAELGLENTHYVNPNGLHDEQHYTSASDLARLMQVCLCSEDFCRISGTYTAQIGVRSLRNHNKLLKSCRGVFSGKTGYTKAAGRCLVSACEREGLRLICVTLRDPCDWEDHAALYDWAYGRYEAYRLEKGSMQGTIPLIGGDTEHLRAVVKNEQCYCVEKGTPVEKRLFLPPFVFVPCRKDTELGYLRLSIGEQGETIPLYPAE